MRESSGVGDWSVAIDLSGGKRPANPNDFQNTFAIFVSDVVYNLRKDLLSACFQQLAIATTAITMARIVAIPSLLFRLGQNSRPIG